MKRMISLYEEDSGGFPLIFIRFNPDPYYFGDKVISAYRDRENTLQTVIKGLKNRTELLYGINVIYLYYDNFNSTDIKIEPFEYKISDGNIIIDHKHPLSSKTIHEYVM